MHRSARVDPYSRAVPARSTAPSLRVERAMLRNVMGRANGNQTQATELLGVNRNTLRAKLAKYDLI